MTVFVRGRVVIQSGSYYLLVGKNMYYISNEDVRRLALDFKIIDIIRGLECMAEKDDNFTQIKTGTIKIVE